MISRLSSIVPTRGARAGLVAIVIALVLVPPLARARQQVEQRDATRLSIKHSWLGVAPPTKASLASVRTIQIAVLPPPVVEVDPARDVVRVHVPLSAVSRDLCDDVSDPLRGPPSDVS